MVSLRGTSPELLKASSHSLTHLILGIDKYFDSNFTRKETMTQRDLVPWLGLPNWERAKLISRSQHGASCPCRNYRDVDPIEMGQHTWQGSRPTRRHFLEEADRLLS